MRVLVTGGAGFIGRHLVRRLMEDGNEVVVLDNFSLKNKHANNESPLESSGLVDIIVGDCRDRRVIQKTMEGVDGIFHLAADPEVRLELADPRQSFENNVVVTYELLEVFKQNKAQFISFTSTSTVYGEPRIIPTPEDYGPLLPISVYGASKLACEALISSFCSSFSKRGIILRLANIVGSDCNRGVIYDFVRKLRDISGNYLEILGDGMQTKSYLHINDCIEALVQTMDGPVGKAEIFNVGSDDQLSVLEIARIVAEEMDLNPEDTKIRLNNIHGDGRGWVGDVRNMLLDNTRLKSIGWRPKYASREAIKLCVRSMLGAES